MAIIPEQISADVIVTEDQMQAITAKIAQTILLVNDEVAARLIEAATALALDVSLRDERIADRLVSANEKLAAVLAASNRQLAEDLVNNNNYLAAELLAENRTIAADLLLAAKNVAADLVKHNKDAENRTEAATSHRFDYLRRWNWSLIATNVMMCCMLAALVAVVVRIAIIQLSQGAF